MGGDASAWASALPGYAQARPCRRQATGPRGLNTRGMLEIASCKYVRSTPSLLNKRVVGPPHEELAGRSPTSLFRRRLSIYQLSNTGQANSGNHYHNTPTNRVSSREIQHESRTW